MTVGYFSLSLQKKKIMQVISITDFRANQTSFLSRVLDGEDIILKSRLGTFKIVPVTDEELIEMYVAHLKQQVQLIKEGKLETRPAEDLLNEL